MRISPFILKGRTPRLGKSVIWKLSWGLRSLPLALGLMSVNFLSSGRLSSQSAPASQPGQRMVDYDRQVHAIIADHCLMCHSSEKRSGGLSLATYDDVMTGGRSGAVVNPGHGADSLITQRLSGAVQPPMPLGMAPLCPQDIATIRLWIDQGARATPASAAAKPKWFPPLALTSPQVPNSPWKEWGDPIDRFTAAYLAKHGIAEPAIVSDEVFARRAYLDVWGLLPDPKDLHEFLADKRPDKRKQLVGHLLADNTKYSENWISFWNDLLRNDEGIVYYSETAARKTITPWLLNALETNKSYHQWIDQLLNPTKADDPDGFLIGVNWRGTVSASQTPALQAAQNSAQIFLGVNLKCNSCHDSFISRWKLKDAYGLASYFSAEPRLQLYRCDVAQSGQFTTASYLYPVLNRPLASDSIADRRATAAAIFTDPRNGRVPRTLVNRIWAKFMGHGLVQNVDDMDGEPWSPELLDWMSSDFVASGYDLKHLIANIISSRTYQLPVVAETANTPAAKEYVFRGPEERRLTAEEFADAVASITGDWHVRAAGVKTGAEIPPGDYVREWRMAGSSLSRSMGRPLRDQVFSTRDEQATTVQALELTNGETLNHWLWRGSRRMLGELPPEPQSLFSRQVRDNDKNHPAAFDIDVSKSQKLYLIVQDALSLAPGKATPLWLHASFTGSGGAAIPLTALKPQNTAGLRNDTSPIILAVSHETMTDALRVKLTSVLVYDIAGKGFTRFHGAPALENVQMLQGEGVTARFFVFDKPPSMDRLVPPNPKTPLPHGPVPKTTPQVVDRVYWYALGRAPSSAERQIAQAALRDPVRPGRPSPDGLADLLWSIMMTPEFQFIR